MIWSSCSFCRSSSSSRSSLSSVCPRRSRQPAAPGSRARQCTHVGGAQLLELGGGLGLAEVVEDPEQLFLLGLELVHEGLGVRVDLGPAVGEDLGESLPLLPLHVDAALGHRPVGPQHRLDELLGEGPAPKHQHKPPCLRGETSLLELVLKVIDVLHPEGVV